MKIKIEEFEGIEPKKYEILKKASKILNELEKEMLEKEMLKKERITALRKKVEFILKKFDMVKYKNKIYFNCRKKPLQKVDLIILYNYEEDYLKQIVESYEDMMIFF